MKIELIGVKNPGLMKELKKSLITLIKQNKCAAKSMAVIFVDNDYIRKLNRKYLGRNRITDVLAFPFGDDFLGEVYVCRQRAKKQAKEFGLTEKEEIFRLARHGLMHLLGHHH